MILCTHACLQDLPESRGALVCLLLVGMFHTIIQELIVIANGSAVCAFVLFGILGGVLVFGLIGVTFNTVKIGDWHCYTLFSLPAESLGAILYFIGDNLSLLVNRYENDVSSDLVATNIASTVCTGLACVIFLLAPQISHV